MHLRLVLAQSPQTQSTGKKREASAAEGEYLMMGPTELPLYTRSRNRLHLFPMGDVLGYESDRSKLRAPLGEARRVVGILLLLPAVYLDAGCRKSHAVGPPASSVRRRQNIFPDEVHRARHTGTVGT